MKNGQNYTFNTDSLLFFSSTFSPTNAPAAPRSPGGGALKGSGDVEDERRVVVAHQQAGGGGVNSYPTD